MRVVVTGGSGFIGGTLLEMLSGKDVEVLAVVHRRKIKQDKNVTLLPGGIAAMTKAVIDDFSPDVIFHCARPTYPQLGRAGRKLAAFRAAGLNKTLLQNLRNSNTSPTLFFLSGSLMYGNGQKAFNESSPLNPVSYARQYYRGEKPVIAAIEDSTLRIKVVRLPWVLGNGSWFQWFYLDTIRQHRAIPRFGDGSNYMEIIDIRDVTEILWQMAATPSPSGIINVPASKPRTQAEFLSFLSRMFEVPVVDYREIFGNRLEREAREAFTSNILLRNTSEQTIANYHYTPLEETLARLRDQVAEP